MGKYIQINRKKCNRISSEDDIKGLFEDVDTTSNKLGATVAEKNKRLCDILTGIDKINLGKFENNDIDAFGDAYEYLISNYASNAGKSGGEFFTPQTVSKLLAKLVMDGKTSIKKVYDPRCGERVITVMGEVCVNKSTVSGTLTKYISCID